LREVPDGTEHFPRKPERIVALGLIMVLCLQIYRLAEHGLRTQLAATGQTIPNQLSKPTGRPTMRWLFQCFEGISLVIFQPPGGLPHREISGLAPLHRQVIRLQGASCEQLNQLGS
jgi:hypothetical protein